MYQNEKRLSSCRVILNEVKDDTMIEKFYYDTSLLQVSQIESCRTLEYLQAKLMHGGK